MKELKEIKPDALIISDPAIFTIAKEEVPEIDIHISTQANNTNYGTYLFWHSLGATRVVSARELSLKEIKEIRRNIPDELEIESFIHGAMCISYSGRCLLSNYFTGRDANRGACTHPCRWKYAVMEESRPGEYFPIEEGQEGTYIFNSKDLCMVEYLPELQDAGVESIKIEGRMKTPLYVAMVTKIYREALDDLKQSRELYESKKAYYKEMLSQVSHRSYTTGFYLQQPGSDEQVYDSADYVKHIDFVGKVLAVAENELAVVEQRGKFSVGDELYLMPKKGKMISVKIDQILDENGNSQESAPHAQQKLQLKLPEEALEGAILLKKR